MIKYLIITAFCLPMVLFESTASAVEKKSQAVNYDEMGEFYIEKDLVDKVYEQTTSLEASRHPSPGTIQPNIGFFSAKDFQLSNEYFRTDYASQIDAIPVLGFVGATKIYQVQNVALNVTYEFGYSYNQDTFFAESASGAFVEDTIVLQWVPVMTGFSIDYSSPWAQWIKPSLGTVGGAHWVHHTGTIDGLEQNVWVPLVGAGMSVSLFPGMESSDTGFNGITVSANYLKSINSDQKIRGMIYKIGSTIKL